MKRIIAALFVSITLLGAFAIIAPTHVAQAKECVICPQIGILCGPCQTLVPQTCNRCAYCKQIPGCHA